jgi:hypothetical protein
MDWRLIVVLLVIAAFAVLWLREGRGRATAKAGDGFGQARRNGYVRADVDALVDAVCAQPATVDGRAEGLRLIAAARFHLDRSGGYEPVAVDRFLDSLSAALRAESELPQRPSAG